MFALRSLGARAANRLVSSPRLTAVAPCRRGMRQTARAQQQGGDEGQVGIQKQGDQGDQRLRMREEPYMSSVPSFRQVRQDRRQHAHADPLGLVEP
eukprot:979132-Pelagomonas_calceolata.AAC.1